MSRATKDPLNIFIEQAGLLERLSTLSPDKVIEIEAIKARIKSLSAEAILLSNPGLSHADVSKIIDKTLQKHTTAHAKYSDEAKKASADFVVSSVAKTASLLTEGRNAAADTHSSAALGFLKAHQTAMTSSAAGSEDSGAHAVAGEASSNHIDS